MKIDDKLTRFRTSDLGDAVSTTVAELEAIGITNSRFLKNCFFEKSVNVCSSIISRTPAAFFGAYSYMNDGGYLRDNVFIGRYCSIGRRVSIGASSHPMAGLSTHPQLVYGRGTPYTESETESLGLKKQSAQPPGFTVIENDVWIGDGALIMKGITLGTGSVIGANSVVTKDIPPYSIVGGVPARVIRYRFPAEVISQLITSQWWEYSLDALKGLPVRNILEFIQEIQAVRTAGTVDFINYKTFKLA